MAFFRQNNECSAAAYATPAVSMRGLPDATSDAVQTDGAADGADGTTGSLEDGGPVPVFGPVSTSSTKSSTELRRSAASANSSSVGASAAPEARRIRSGNWQVDRWCSFIFM